MIAEEDMPCQAKTEKELMDFLNDPSFPKTEAEHFAARKIRRLITALEEADSDLCAWMDKCAEAKAKLKAAEKRIEELEKAEAHIQTCENGHKFYAQSHEYPCPRCIIANSLGALSDIRTLVTSCVPRGVQGKFKETCKAVLARSLAKRIEYSIPSWFRHKWEKEIYNQALRKDGKE